MGSALAVICALDIACARRSSTVEETTKSAPEVPEQVSAPKAEPPAPALEPAPAPEPEPEPEQIVLEGIDGAAQALAAGDPEVALHRLAATERAAEGLPEWYRERALRGRAARLTGDYAASAAALESLVKRRHLSRYLPPEIIELELALTTLAWQAHGDLEREEADRRLAEVSKILSRAQKHRPIRNLAAIRVTQARVLAAIDGSSGGSTSAVRGAGLRASKALKRIIKDYPNHPEVGEHRLALARALLRAGRITEGAEELRTLAIDRPGEPEGDAAWSELVELSEVEKRVKTPKLSRGERLHQAEKARSLRNVELSRSILDEILEEERLPPATESSARRSRAWTTYKERDYAACVADLEYLYSKVKSAETRDFLARCLDRGAFYDRVLELLLAQTKGKSGRGQTGRLALWASIKQAVRAGRYVQAQELLVRFGKKFKGHGSERQWLGAWLRMRTGDLSGAIQALEPLERRGGDRVRAQYFRGRLLLAGADPQQRAEGEAKLRELVERRGLEYYGLMARQRLLDASLDPGPVPEITPVAGEGEPQDPRVVVATFDELAEGYGEELPALRRARALHSVGYLDEARRELRIAIDEHLELTGRTGYEPHHEDRYVGLCWRPTWKQPKLSLSREARKLHRDREQSEALRRGLRLLANALDEPHRFARLSSREDGSLRMRWYLRAFSDDVEREAEAEGIDPIHLWALMYTESRFRSHVLSPAGARGVLQIMPWTGKQLSARLGELGARFDADTLFNPAVNIHLAAHYVAELLKKFHGQPAFAYGSYNGGPSNVSRWLQAKSSQSPLELDVYIEEIPFSETGRYTKRVLETQAIYSLLYRGELPRWTNEVDPSFEDNIDF
ncbi:MAG TPA: hypothetical protein ENJ18_10770 [Nannocystis exedens]|nr:hypothetical protein [Nannocystis exedens]